MGIVLNDPELYNKAKYSDTNYQNMKTTKDAFTISEVFQIYGMNKDEIDKKLMYEYIRMGMSKSGVSPHYVIHNSPSLKLTNVSDKAAVRLLYLGDREECILVDLTADIKESDIEQIMIIKDVHNELVNILGFEPQGSNATGSNSYKSLIESKTEVDEQWNMDDGDFLRLLLNPTNHSIRIFRLNKDYVDFVNEAMSQ